MSCLIWVSLDRLFALVLPDTRAPPDRQRLAPQATAYEQVAAHSTHRTRLAIHERVNDTSRDCRPAAAKALCGPRRGPCPATAPCCPFPLRAAAQARLAWDDRRAGTDRAWASRTECFWQDQYECACRAWCPKRIDSSLQAWAMFRSGSRSADSETRHQTPLERLDANLEELTGKLQVVATGV